MTPDTGFFDLQVNGYAGVDFNQDDLGADALHRCCRRLAEDGVAGILATIITEKLETMASRVRRLVALRRADPVCERLIAGIHLEGPFLRPEVGYNGGHPLDAMQPATPEAVETLLEAGDGLVRLVTLAPEVDAGMRTTRYLTDSGVVVAAGHTDASLGQLGQAVDAGLTIMTHLGNGCPAVMPRHDNIIERALALRDRLWLCFIADGIHIPFFALATYLTLAGPDRALVVTDTMAAGGVGPGRFTVGRWDLVVGEDMAVWSHDRTHLVGSAIAMRQAAQNLRQHLALDERYGPASLRHQPPPCAFDLPAADHAGSTPLIAAGDNEIVTMHQHSSVGSFTLREVHLWGWKRRIEGRCAFHNSAPSTISERRIGFPTLNSVADDGGPPLDRRLRLECPPGPCPGTRTKPASTFSRRCSATPMSSTWPWAAGSCATRPAAAATRCWASFFPRRTTLCSRL